MARIYGSLQLMRWRCSVISPVRENRTVLVIDLCITLDIEKAPSITSRVFSSEIYLFKTAFSCLARSREVTYNSKVGVYSGSLNLDRYLPLDRVLEDIGSRIILSYFFICHCHALLVSTLGSV